MEIREALVPGNVYHICTKSVGGELIFRNVRDFGYFQKKMKERLTEAWDILAYTLLPGEIHFAVKIVKTEIDGEVINHSILLGHLLNGYVQHYNYVHARNGSLLNRSFRRKKMSGDDEIRDLICKIHNLPVAQKLVKRKEDWHHSSFVKIKSRTSSWISSAIIYALFGEVGEFDRKHSLDNMFEECLLLPKKWIRKFTHYELLFMMENPLGGHRWSRRSKPPPPD